jgi:hypothetical protein
LTHQHPTTPLASSQINNDRLAVELVEPDGRPPMVKVTWPAHPSLIDPKAFPDAAAAVASLFARAHIVLASLKAGGDL